MSIANKMGRRHFTCVRFSDGGAQPHAELPKDSTPNAAAETPANGEPKTFTQEELDSIVKDRLNRAKKDSPAKEELDQFRKWQEGQKTAEQKTQEQINDEKSARTLAEQRATALEAKIICLTAGVRPEFADDAVILAQRLVSDSTDISKAIGEIVKKYPAFTGAVAPGVTISTATQNKPGVISDVEQAFYNINPNLKK